MLKNRILSFNINCLIPILIVHICFIFDKEKKVHSRRYHNESVNEKRNVYSAHETAICRNPPIHSFAEDRKNLTDSYENIRTSSLFFADNILTEGVSVNQLSSGAGISV
jgi:hypothetical protein